MSDAMMLRFAERLPPRDGIASGWEASRSRPFGPYYLLFLFLLALIPPETRAAVPRFFESNRMAILLLPDDTEVDSIIYRLRAEDSDRDYPLLFQVKGPIGRNLIRIESHDCTPSSQIYCEADVYLLRKVENRRVYTFNLTVTDQRGFHTEVGSRITANAGISTKTSDIFLRFPTSVVIREDIPAKAIIASIIARRRPRATFGEFQVLGKARKLFKASAANLISEDTINGTLTVESSMDYEIANLHTFKVCLLEPYTNEVYDTRNIACVIISVVIEDVQDEPPIFVNAPPVTRIPALAIKGDIIGRIVARDGDRGEPRSLRYSMLPSSSFYKNYFRIDVLSGNISMNNSAHKLKENMVSLDPILMTITAEEVIGFGEQYPALSSSCEVAFVVLDAELLVPKFVHEKYVGEIYEDSVPDSQVFFDSPFLVQGVKGLFALELDGDNGAFSVQPGVVKDASEIKIKVKNSFLIDYEETPQITFKLLARQVSGPQQLSGSTEITVRLLDTNDNIPKFSKQQYEVDIFENVTRGATIVRVYATDKDSGPFGVIRYTNMYGPLADRLYLDQTTGLITCSTDNHGLDREAASEYIITVEARDNNGQGTASNTATTKVIVRMKDVNDSPPKFLESLYKGVMAPDYQRLKDPIRIRAVDQDAERPNNEVVYEIERSSYSEFFQIDRNSGYLDVRQNYIPRFSALNSKKEVKSRQERSLLDNDTVITLRVRASDLGEPQLSETVDVKIFKQEFGERLIRFIYPKPYLDVRTSTRDIEKVLNSLTGGSTEILNVQPLSSGFLGSDLDPGRSEVTALVRFGVDTVVDLQQLLSKLNNTEVQKLKTEKLQKEEVIKTMEGQNYSYLLGVVFLCIILCMIITIIILCCLCEGCPLYNQNGSKYNMVGNEGGEGSGYVRNSDGSKYRRAQNDQSWFNSMPKFAKDIIVAFGYIPPDRAAKSKMAWSADERQRHWQMNNNHPPEVSSYVGANNPRGEVIMEDLDDGQYNRSDRPRADQFMRGDSRLSHRSQEPKRVFVIKDPRGERIGGSMRDGDTYLLEENDENGINHQAERPIVMNGQEGDYNYPGQGNAQLLRLSTSLPDAAFTNDRQRRVRRTGAETEESARHFIDPGGGMSSRSIDAQSFGAVVRNNRDYYADDRRSYDPRTQPRHNDAYIQTEDGTRDPQYIPRMNMIREESLNKGDGQNARSSRTRRSLRSDRPEKTTKETPRKTSQSAKSNNIPGTHGYQHTKTSILRYESNKAKLDEEREELIRQGKDPTLCLVNHGGGNNLEWEGRKASVNSRANSKYEKRSHQERRERRGSLPDVDTTSENGSPVVLQRRNSAENYNQTYLTDDNLDRIVYVNEANQPLVRQAQNRNNIIAADGLRIVDGIVQMPYTTIPNQAYVTQNGIAYPIANNIPGDRDIPQVIQSNQLYNPALFQSVPTGVPIPPTLPAAYSQNINQGQPYYQPTGQQIIQLPPMLNDSDQGNAQQLPINDIQQNQPLDGPLPNTNNIPSESTSDLPIPTEQSKNLEETNESNILSGSLTSANPSTDNKSEGRRAKRPKPKDSQELNLPDDLKSAKTRKVGLYNENLIQEKTTRNDQSVMNIPQDLRKKNKMLEKKSVFTIAYDGVKTDQLRPESGAQEP